ncbi:SDR family oxidoreductase [Bacillus gobiensis]|uniref:SDR family oxidoreductase n=1 Tax=Bacillus gobiensis TaxID=1441095 RepID=UPI003D1CA0F7
MKVLILGGKGMAGHVITDYLKKNPNYYVLYTSRDLNDKDAIYLDARDFDRLETIVASHKPRIIINCIGILNEQGNSNPLETFQINSLLPRRLAQIAGLYHGKLIQISTDCVFSGKVGSYTENAIPDGTSIYAQSKQLGEVTCGNHLTIRTSIIGPELKDDGIGLFLWFMNQTGEINGYEKVLWNGVTTLELAKAIEEMIEKQVTGLYHLGSETKISKYDLLKAIQSVFAKNDVTIRRDQAFVLDRTIKNTRTDFLYTPPSYRQMLIELKDWMKIYGSKK